MKAYKYAIDNHGNQVRMSGEPYMIHPLNVAYILSELGMDDETICAALLHDVVEDTAKTHDDIVNMFGEEIAEMVADYDGKIAVCGGTTANIIERELCLKCEIDKTSFDTKIPMASKMEGIDLVTEGILTLTDAYRMLKEGVDKNSNTASVRLVKLFLSSDKIDFVVGTKINVAHQDPNLPMELEIRRNIVKKIFRLLQSQYLKEISVRYL
jgi:hypothetical protein